MSIEDATAQLRRASAKFHASKKAYEARRSEVRDAIVAAAAAGVPQKEIIDLTGYTRESVRQITRAGGVGGG